MTHEEAVRELYYWQYDWTGSFYNILLMLIQKADSLNKARLHLAFPEIFEAYMEWRDAPDQDEFFAKYGLTPRPHGSEKHNSEEK